MLKKLTELEVPSDAPFTNEPLDRKSAIERLTNLIESTEQAFVLSVEAPWGWGKTTFIRMWKAYLQSKGHVCLHFNAWENDFVDDPLVAFLGEMKRFVEAETKNLGADDPLRTHWNEVKRIGAGVLRKTLPLAVQIATHGLLTQEKVKQIAGAVTEKADEVGEFASKLAKERLEKYESERDGIKEFRSSLEKLAQDLATKVGHSSPLVFFIDELDRCRPDFAVMLLERIKHLFNVDRIVFVLAVDRRQLNESVKALYGAGMDADGYLRRFIDLGFVLPPPKPDIFAETLFRKFDLQEYFRQRHNGSDYARVLLTGFSKYSNCFGLSLRAQEQCFTEMNVALRMTPPNGRIYPAVLSFLVTLRAFKPGIFGDLREGRQQISTVLSWVVVDDEWYRSWTEATLLVGFAPRNVQEARYQELKRQLESGSEADKAKAEVLRRLVGALQEDFCNGAHLVLSQLEMTTQFH